MIWNFETLRKYLYDIPSNCCNHWYKSSRSMGSSSESICEPRPAPVARGQRRKDEDDAADVFGRKTPRTCTPDGPLIFGRLTVDAAASFCNKLPPWITRSVAAAAVTNERVDGITEAGRLVTSRGRRDVSHRQRALMERW